MGGVCAPHSASYQNDLELYYRYAPILVRRIPREAIESFKRQPSLDVTRLLPALLPPGPRKPNVVTQAIRYLEHSIFSLANTDSTVHNSLLCLFTDRSHSDGASDDEGDLLHFLNTAPHDPGTQQPYYDLDYALRICKANRRFQACVLIYSKMGLWESSVDLALEHGDLELAKINADLPRDDDLLRKKLWLKIAKHVVKDQNDLKT